MEISANAMTEGNPGGGIGGLMQMIASFGNGQATSVGASAADGQVGGNPFSEVLLQQISALLQSGGANFTGNSETIKDLSAALEKLMGQDPSANDEVLSELAFLALCSQTTVTGDESQTMMGDALLSTSGEGDISADMEEGKACSQAGELTSFIVKTLQQGLKETNQSGEGQRRTGLGLTAAGDGSLQQVSVASQKDHTISNHDGSDFSSSMEGVPTSSAANEQDANRTGVSGERTEGQRSLEAALLNDRSSKADQSGDPGLNTADASKTGVSENKMEGQNRLFEDLMNKAADDQIKAKMTNILHPENNTMENTAVEDQISKSGLPLKMAAAGADVSRREAVEAAKEGDGSKIVLDSSDPAGIVTKEASAEEGHGLYDRRGEHQEKEGKNNVTGKAFSEHVNANQVSVNAGEKIKGKGAAIEKKSESQMPNVAITPGGVQVKSETGEISSSSIINRVAAEFRDQFMGEGGRVKITLTPPSLGSVEMDVAVQNSKVKVMLIAENKEVQKILSGNLETLKGSLQSQGLTIERCDVMTQDHREEYGQGFNGNQNFGQEQTPRERTSRQASFEKKAATGPAAVKVQSPAYNPRYTGSESISLFA